MLLETLLTGNIGDLQFQDIILKFRNVAEPSYTGEVFYDKIQYITIKLSVTLWGLIRLLNSLDLGELTVT